MLCFLAHCTDVNTDNKRGSKIQRTGYLKTETQTFKYFYYHLCNVCPLKNTDKRKQKSPIKLPMRENCHGGALSTWLTHKEWQLEIFPGGLYWCHHLTVFLKGNEELPLTLRMWERFSRNCPALLCLCKSLVKELYRCPTSTRKI